MSDLLLFRARFTDYSFRRHAHDGYAIGVIEEGEERFFHRGAAHAVVPGQVVTINPGEVHDGEPGTRDGFRYRMMYPSEELITEILGGAGFPGPPVRFPSATVDDPPWTHEFIRFHRAIERTDGLCELWVRQRLSALLGPFFARWGQSPGTAATEPGNERAVRRAAEYIRANAAGGVLLRDAAAVAELSQYHFLRTFTKVLGVSPHAYRMLRCVELARASILRGLPLARASLDAGFADQSHCTRWFRAVYGVAPGSFRRACVEEQFRSR